ncbi:hypothetical protein D6D10_09942 [Aureobasidium pullulans]|uniref:Uncharacterized protein n=1 Tax=Aureobasidium pullulans TaxID=5580 RepID=A0A4S9DVJ1_AURPU|nr:hypothetical protein D6D10_09942 [Aureobasidium pullulans]
MTSKISVLAFFTVLAAARTFSGADLNFGELNQTFTAPTINHAVKVPIGNKNFSLNVMIAEFEPPANTTTDLQNPRVAATIYELSWPWNTTINETLKTLEGVEEPRFCVSIPLGPIPDSVTKAYKETDLGDCTNALGEQCTRDLKNQGFAPDVGCNTPILESCSGKLGSGSVGSAPLLNRPPPLKDKKSALSNGQEPVPMHDTEIIRDWKGVSEIEPLAREGMLPAVVRGQPRAYLVLPRRNIYRSTGEGYGCGSDNFETT